MSYDLALFRLSPTADPASVYQQLMEEEEQGSMGPGEIDLQFLADRLKARRPTLTQSSSAPPLQWIQLSDEALDFLIVLDRHKATINMPYFRPSEKEVMRLAGDCCDVLREAAGYVAFDPQLDRLVTAADFGEMAGRYREMDRVLPELQKRATKPWWKFW